MSVSPYSTRALIGVAVFAWCVAGLAGTGSADPVFFAGTGHSYELVLQPGIGWDAAKTDAEGRSYLGNPGYLATITSQAENDFIRDAILDATPLDHFWLGGNQSPNTQEPTGNWCWVTGEAWTFTNWNAGEPNDSYAGEDVLMIYSNAYPSGRWGYWNDLSRQTGQEYVGGYILESNAAGVVPVPGAFLMVTVGVGLVALARRRRK